MCRSKFREIQVAGAQRIGKARYKFVRDQTHMPSSKALSRKRVTRV